MPVESFKFLELGLWPNCRLPEKSNVVGLHWVVQLVGSLDESRLFGSKLPKENSSSSFVISW
jgi:hypothetical protein